MILRAIPFALCLAWLVYESHGSPSFFVATLETSFASIMGGVEDVILAEYPTYLKTASAPGAQ